MKNGLTIILKDIALMLLIITGITAHSCSSTSKQNSEMEKTAQAETKQTVTSKDGTKIAYEKRGEGPAIILVNGALSTSTAFNELAGLLESSMTVYNYDRRGRGASGDNQRYSLDAEIEDLEALIEAAGGSAYLHGHSSGACLAFEAAAKLGDKVKKLCMYEAPYDDSEGAAEKWNEYKIKYKQLIAEDRRGDAVEHHLKFVGVPDVALAGMKASPAWSGFEDLAPTLAYDIAAVGEERKVPADRAAKVKAKTLIMDGGESAKKMPFMRASADKLAKAIPDASRKTIEGQSHDLSSRVVAPVLTEFFVKN
jgi:pimeloyl-ACP methyl ester carboxylesterase